MQFRTIRQGMTTYLDTDPAITTFTKGGAAIATRLSNAQVSQKLVAGVGPVLDVTNFGTSGILLTSVQARVNNSQDPMDLSQDFVPDGAAVALTPLLGSGGVIISPGSTDEFSFDLPANTRNWSFETVTVDSSNVIYDDVVATDVPEPGQLALFGTAVIILIIAVAQRQSGLKNLTRP